MRYTRFLLVLLLSCSLGLSVTKNAFGEEDKTGKVTRGTSPFPPIVDVQFTYSIDGYSFQPLSEGATLHSGQRYRIEFTPHEDCVIRVYQVDSTRVTKVLEGADRLQVKANSRYELPNIGKAYTLDNVVGRETIYFEAFRREESKGRREESKGPGPTVPIGASSCQGPCVKSVTFQHVD